MRIWLDHAKGLHTKDGSAVKGFVVAGADGVFRNAKSVIEGETIVVSNPLVNNPVNVRYAFKDAPEVNLVNGAGLPAVPFRTDESEHL